MMNCSGQQTKMNKAEKRMNVKKRLLQGVILLCVVWYQSTFLAAFFGETGGIVKYAEWAGDGGVFRRMDMQYDAAFALGIAVTVIFVLEIGVTLYGVRTGTALVLPAVIVGMMLFYGAMVQVLYGENAIILHTALTIAGAALAFVCIRYVKRRLSEWLWKVLLLLGGFVTLAVLAAAAAEKFASVPVIEGGGISAGDIVFYPGDILKVLLIFLAACSFIGKSGRNITKLYSGLAITAALVLVLLGDGGNAFIILVIFAISSAYLYEKRGTVLKTVLVGGRHCMCTTDHPGSKRGLSGLLSYAYERYRMEEHIAVGCTGRRNQGNGRGRRDLCCGRGQVFQYNRLFKCPGGGVRSSCFDYSCRRSFVPVSSDLQNVEPEIICTYAWNTGNSSIVHSIYASHRGLPECPSFIRNCRTVYQYRYLWNSRKLFNVWDDDRGASGRK